MAASGAGAVNASEYEVALLINSSISSTSIVEGAVDYRGERVVDRSKYGGWRSASFIIGLDIAETFTYFGITSNLISYLTGPLGQSTVNAAQNINTWVGVVMMLPLLGGFVGDSYLGRFRSIVVSSLIYILGLGLLALSAAVPSLRPPDCPNNSESNPSCTPPSFQVTFFFFSLYLVAIGRAVYKPCTLAFGADQFDGKDTVECKSKGSFFNLWNLGLCFGGISSHLTLNYIQDNLGWGLGFGIPCISIATALIVFLLGTKTYRYTMTEDKENPMSRISRVIIAAAKNWKTKKSSFATIKEDKTGRQCFQADHQFNFLDKALIDTSKDAIRSRQNGTPTCSSSQVQEARTVLHLLPIWISCLMYAVVATQSTTFFAKQASTMDRSIGPKFQIPAASIQMFISLSLIFFIMIYDRLLVPLARAFTGKPNGITTLQRIGGGIFTSIIVMVVAAVVEKKRLQTALDFGLIDMPKATVPMKVWWLLPQYILLGLAFVFSMVGLQEFFYDQVPNGLRSFGLSLCSSIFGVGSFLSGFLISVIDRVTSENDHTSWFSDNLNRAHLDYFYWVVVGLSLVQFVAYLYFSKNYRYNLKI